MSPVRVRSHVGRAVAGIVVPALVLISAPAATAAGDRTTLDVLRVVDGQYVVETVTVPAADTESSEASLEARGDVVDASPAVTYQVQGTPDPYWQSDDPPAVSSVRDVWPSTRGAGQIVAVLDTAVDTSHPDLVGAFVPGTDTSGQAADATEWHGTAVAGVIAARADNGQGGAGMAPESRIMPVRVCANSGCSSAAVARGVLWAADHGADVINMSLAGAGYSDVTAAAIRYALDKNISVVASSGNSGLDGNPVMYPAANSGVIAVSATAADGAPADWAVHGWQADIATVGEGVVVPYLDAGYVSASGTSFSGPAVAGAVALLRAGFPGITPEQVQAVLQAGADASGTWDRAWGAGRLTLPAAFAAVERTVPVVTAVPSSGRVDVSWDAVAGANSYTVRVDGVVRTSTAGLGATVTGLVDGNQVAVDVQPDNGARSRPVLTTVGPSAPAMPTLHSATLGGTSTSASITLSASVAGSSAPRYSVLRDGVSIGTITVTLSSTPRSISIAIGPMPTYETRWQLRGVDDLGRTSPDSNAVVAGEGQPAPPGAVSGLAARVDGGTLLLTWDDVGTAYTYRVRVSGTVVARPVTAGVAVEAPPVGVSRTYDVAVVDAWGQLGPESPITVSGTAASRPDAPGFVEATAGDGRATVSWAAADDNGSPITGYAVTATPGGATVRTAGTTSATVTGLSNGTSYTFTVAATNEVGTGPASAPSAAVTPTAPVTDRLSAGAQLVAGQQLVSPNGRYTLQVQGDGNLVVYAPDRRALWHARTWGNAGVRLALQGDGNLVLYASNRSALWHSDTWGNLGGQLVLQDDGNLVLYTAQGRAVWFTGWDRGATAANDTLWNRQQLTAGQSLVSANGQYTAVVQGDGNVVVYAARQGALWHTRTWGRPGSRLALQADGNLVVYTPSRQAPWHAATFGHANDRLVMQNDGNLVLYAGNGRALWSSLFGRAY